jgi:hypothetical protein
MSKHLTLNFYTASYENENRHPLDIMKSLGITYQHKTPQSMGDCWWFWNCENIPDVLPSYIKELEIDDPLKYVGWGLSEEDALKIKNYE